MSTVSDTTLVFDCDGVLFDSNELKTRAFREVLGGFPGTTVDQFIDYHRRNGGVSRYEKFETFQTDFLKTGSNDSLTASLLTNFGAACQRLYLEAPLTKGCRDTLEFYKHLVPMFVATGSDEKELRGVLEQRKLAQYFLATYGSPRPKGECVKRILSRPDATAASILIGDSGTDYKVAQQYGLPFIFVSRYSEDKMFMESKAFGQDFTVIATLAELPDVLP